mgnify:CR=1 FL=1
MTIFRLTYAFDKETIYTVELATEADDFAAILEESVEYIEKEHDPQEVLKLVGMSVLIIEGDVRE